MDRTQKFITKKIRKLLLPYTAFFYDEMLKFQNETLGTYWPDLSRDEIFYPIQRKLKGIEIDMYYTYKKVRKLNKTTRKRG